MSACFGPAQILLPPPQVPLGTWACVAVDQFTSQPEYWQKAEALTAGRPSTLHIVLPEAYLGTPQQAPRLESIRRTMREYRRTLLTRRVDGFVYVERTQQDGSIRQGLVGAVDLDAYSYQHGAHSPIRPSERTVVERIPPRLAVRRGAELETPHVLMLADDPADRLLGPIAARKAALPQLYDGDLMLGGGHLAGWAVEDPGLVTGVAEAMAALADPAAFAARWPGADPQPMVLAVGDGNHSLATAKAWWEELKPTLPPALRAVHPARRCLVEVCNVHSPAICIEPIHRLLLGVTPEAFRTAFAAWLEAHGARLAEDGEQAFTLVGRAGTQRLAVAAPPAPLTVGTVEAFLDDWQTREPALRVDYIHGAATARAMADRADGPAAALLLPDLRKDDLFRGVVLGGVLPRKTFSMGHAEEKRYYNECRSLVCADHGQESNHAD